MKQRPPGSTRTTTRFPNTTLFRAVLGTVEACYMAQAYHAVLGGRLIDDQLVAVQAADRRRQHDAAVVLIAHQRERFAHDMKRTAQMHVKQRVEIVVAALAQRRSEEYTSELQSLMRKSFAVLVLKKKRKQHRNQTI